MRGGDLFVPHVASSHVPGGYEDSFRNCSAPTSTVSGDYRVERCSRDIFHPISEHTVQNIAHPRHNLSNLTWQLSRQVTIGRVRHSFRSLNARSHEQSRRSTWLPVWLGTGTEVRTCPTQTLALFSSRSCALRRPRLRHLGPDSVTEICV